MPYTQFVEVGRICLISFGPLVDQLAVIVDIVDENRVLIDVISSEESRQTIPIKRLKLTEFKVAINKAGDRAEIAKVIQTEGISKKFAETKWGQRLQRQKAATQLNDFQRFKHQKLVAQRDAKVAEILKKH